MDAVVAVTVLCIRLFVLHGCMLGECEGARVTVNGVGDGGVVVVSGGHEYVGSTLTC